MEEKKSNSNEERSKSPGDSGSFRLTRREWEQIKEGCVVRKTGKEVKKKKVSKEYSAGEGWRRIVLPHVSTFNGGYCNVQGGQARLYIKPSHRPYAVGYTRCRRKAGKNEDRSCDVCYRLVVDSEPDSEAEFVEFKVEKTSGSVVESHGCQTQKFWKSKLGGKERDEMKDKIRHCNTTVTQFIKMVREMESEGRLHEDAFLEIHELQKQLEEEEKALLEEQGIRPSQNRVYGFVQAISLLPFYTILFSERSVRVAKEIVRSGKESVLNIDASGSICKAVGGAKAPFLYVLILRSEKEHLNMGSPIAYFLSSKHDTESIRHAISSFFSQISKRVPGDWNFTPSIAVSDHSLPILRAESLAFNGQALYKTGSCEMAVERGVTSAEIADATILRVCSFHTLKGFPLKPGKTKDERQFNHQARLILAKILMSESIQRLRALLQSAGVIFSATKYTEGVEQAVSDYDELSIAPGAMLEELEKMRTVEETTVLEKRTADSAGAETTASSSGSDWDKEDQDAIGGSLHLRKYLDKPPSRDEEEEEELLRDVNFTAETQRERSPWHRDLGSYIEVGVKRAKELDGSGPTEKSQNPYHHPALIHHLKTEFSQHAPLLTCVMGKPQRYSSDLPVEKKPKVDGLQTTLTNNAAEGAFSHIKSLETEQQFRTINVLGRRKGKLLPAQFIRNLHQSHSNDASSLAQAMKTGGQGPLHAIVPNKRKSKKVEVEEEEALSDVEKEGDGVRQGEEGDGKEEEGDDAVVETWAKKSPSKSPTKQANKFLSPEKRLSLTLLTPAKKGQEKKKTKKKGNQSRKTTAVSSDEDAPEPGKKRKHSVSPVRKVRPLRSCAVRGLDGGAAAKAEADAVEAAAEAASFHGPIWQKLQERAGKGSALTHPSPPLHVPVSPSPSPTPPPAPSSKPMTVDTASDSVAVDTASDSADNDIIFATPVKPRSKAKTRARSPSPEGIPDPARWDLLQYVQSKVFPTIPKCFHGYIPPAPSRVFVSGPSSARNDAPARLETKTAGQPARSRKPGAATDRGWDGRFPAPDRHRKTHLLPQSWGLTKPGPRDGIRFHAVDTCTIDGEVMLLERYERVSGGAVSTFLKDIGRKSLAAALKLITMPGDSHWIGTDDFRREVVSLMGVKESTSEGESRYSLWGDHRYVFLRIFGETAGLTYTVSCDCHATYKRVPMLELMASIHAQSSLSDQLLALLNIDCMFWRSCATCGGKLKKLDIFPSHHLNFILPVEIHGGTITCASDVGKGEEWSWLRTLRELPRSVTIPGARNASESEGDFVLEALVIYSNRNHFQMILTDVDGNFAFIYDGMRRPKIRPFNASELLASLAEGLDEKQEPTVSPTTAYYLRALEKPREGMGIVPSASIGSTANASSRRHNLPRKFRDQAEDY